MSANKRYGRGFTLVEVMIVAVIAWVVAYLFYQLVMQTTYATRYALAFNQMATSCQKAANQLKEDLSTAKEVFGLRFEPGTDPPVASDTYAPNIRASEYRIELELSPTALPLGEEIQPREGTGLLPVLDPNGMFGPDDATVRRTGNCLLFTRTEAAFSARTRYGPVVVGDPEANTRLIMIDVFRLVYYYLTRVPGADVGGVEDGLSLVRWESIRFVDKGQLDALAERDPLPIPGDHPWDENDPKTGPPDQTEIDATLPVMQSEFIRQLVEDEGINYCWDTTQDASSAFYELTQDAVSGDYVIDSSPVSAFDASSTNLNIPMNKFEHVILNLASKHATVSWNTPGNEFIAGMGNQFKVNYGNYFRFQSPVLVPRFGYPDVSLSGPGFPHGFEVQVIGPSGARQVLVRLVLAKETWQKRIAAHETVTIVSTRDF
ncbi:MAG: prepilin-type N-terminal cleavage/methylation domain-containing protein [Planctomycetes bacterium]|nr:prepilin-type N-terminal cleavage/methylation domain-containing protein [Planctomycetota bacterium]